MKYGNAIMLVLFLLSAFVQFNDPDPLAWILMYSAAAVVCTASLLQKFSWLFSASVALIAALWATILVLQLVETDEAIVWSQVFSDVKMKSMAVELAREIGGLLIIIGWMLIMSLHAFSFKTNTSTPLKPETRSSNISLP